MFWNSLNLVRKVAEIETGSRVTRCVCEKNRPNCSPTNFCQNLFITCTTEKVAQNIGFFYTFIRNTAQIKESLIGRKFAESGHPDWEQRSATVYRAVNMLKRIGAKAPKKKIDPKCDGQQGCQMVYIFSNQKSRFG
jgi:hypothetical protein